ncbi:WYL domain-containing protein [Photobacterium sp. ZSDE20]|uniref:WYL domain-containing protein n=1 Tax=Photobacterium pectinilyticum TaxID=2906793 RepID=A0ABT1N7E3_9GAMM|nr:WYL domain-containing protein [Photobacterium sp. ZSDE20]MCQ1060467.1 WYL domain-containing protein [Photobacterium sp. ZSDE20]MDD1826217.1 WYL domain-containing protein [Photobacterium sp. ZSDE20]
MNIRIKQQLEMALLWEGGIDRTQLAYRCGTSVRSIQRFMNELARQDDGRIKYNAKTRRYQLEAELGKASISEDPELYLRYCRGEKMLQPLLQEEFENRFPVEDIEDLVTSTLDDHVVNTLIDAINGRKQIRCTYESTKGERADILLSPHTIVYARRRYHVRAYHHTKGLYGDFVLGRFLSICIASGEGEGYSSIHDLDWHQHINLNFLLNPELDDHEKRRSILEWNLSINQNTIKRRVRRALTRYVRIEMTTPPTSSKHPTWIIG